MALSPRQERAFRFIQNFIASNGHAPTIVEINRFFGYRSTSTGHKILVSLENEGLIRRPKVKAWRGIEIVQEKQAA
jgi:SOS-response transcriptional repressor LexA